MANSDKQIISCFNNMQLFALSLIISAVLLFLCSKNSIIYPMNDWTDVNTFFSVMDSMFQGNVLYRDVYDHKGPFLYLGIYGLAHFLGNSYFTLYLFECIANALFVFFSTKIILLYDDSATKVRTFLYALCLEVCFCTSAAFMFGGTVEELFLWTSSLGLYLTLRCLKNDQYYSIKEIVWMGVLCGIIFWTKFSILGFYSGLALYVIIWNITQKNFSRLGKTIAIFLGGFAVSCIPELIYCAITQSFSDMINVYFIGNVFGNHEYAGSPSLRYELQSVVYKDFGLALLILLGIIFYAVKYNIKVKILIVITFLTSVLASCCLVFFTTYYLIPLIAYIPLGIAALKNMNLKFKYGTMTAAAVLMIHLFISPDFILHSPIIGNKLNYIYWSEYCRLLIKASIPLLLLFAAFKQINAKQSSRIIFLECACFEIISAFICYMIRNPLYFIEQSLPQKSLAQTIAQVDNANILLYKLFNHGFYRPSNTYPQVKYFAHFNLIADDMASEQLSYIKSETVDFIVTFEELDEEIRGTSYKVVDIAEPYYYLNRYYTFYLYGKDGVKKQQHQVNPNRILP